LEPKTREELEELLQGNELDFRSFCNQLPISDTIQSIASSVVDENAVMARSNLDRQEELNQLHTKVTGLQKQLEKKVKAFQELEQKQNALIAPPDTRDILRQLAKAKKQAFDESEQMAEDWLEEGGDVKDFLDCILEKRVVHHVRAAKMELLQYNNDTNNGDGNNR
jgi:cell division septum initiation protein DivIVA